jgi:hypothetical protein
MSTKAEIRQRVAEELYIIPIGQAPEAQDQARIDATFDETYERLKEKGLATWVVTADVPNKLVPYFVQMMCEKLLVSYSVPESRYLRIKEDAGPNGSVAMANLAELAVPEYTSRDSDAGF